MKKKVTIFITFLIIILVVAVVISLSLFDFGSGDELPDTEPEVSFNPLSEEPLFDNWYLSEIDSEENWILYDPMLEEYLLYNETAIY